MDETQNNNAQNSNNNEEIKQKLEQCEKLRDEYLDGWKRVKADFINYKKDETQRLERFLKFSNEQMVREFITVLDSFDLGMAALKDDEQAYAGMQLIRNQCEDVLKRYGLEMIKINEGDAFDPALHEAVGEEEIDKPSNTIIKEIGHGYTLHGKIIRPARVKVAKQKNI